MGRRVGREEHQLEGVEQCVLWTDRAARVGVSRPIFIGPARCLGIFKPVMDAGPKSRLGWLHPGHNSI